LFFFILAKHTENEVANPPSFSSPLRAPFLHPFPLWSVMAPIMASHTGNEAGTLYGEMVGMERQNKINVSIFLAG